MVTTEKLTEAVKQLGNDARRLSIRTFEEGVTAQEVAELLKQVEQLGGEIKTIEEGDNPQEQRKKLFTSLESVKGLLVALNGSPRLSN